MTTWWQLSPDWGVLEFEPADDGTPALELEIDRVGDVLVATWRTERGERLRVFRAPRV